MQETILIVDDSRLILESLSYLLREEQVQVLTARDAAEAGDLVRKEDIAVVISDNIMPGMTGLELFSGLKTVSPHSVKILM